MANVVRVTVSEAQSGVNNFNIKLGDLSAKINKLNITAVQTETWWLGSTGTSFRESFGRACTQFNTQMTTTLQAHGQKMLQSAEAQQTQDTNMASQIKRH